MSFSKAADDLSGQAIGAGIVTAIVGYTSSVAIVIHGLGGVGANEAQTMSALAVLCVAQGIAAILLSLATRMPISAAWSTPGMVLIATTAPLAGGFNDAVGAFIAVGLAIIITGSWPALGRLVSVIPRPISSAMLAGILYKLCVAPVLALGAAPIPAMVILVVWLLAMRMARRWAAPAALAVALGFLALQDSQEPLSWALPRLEWVTPTFSWQAMISVALPLYLVTMASQNIPGLAVLHSFDYHPKVPPIFLATGGLSALSAFFGGPTVNLAAITAVLCAGPDAHPDPRRRYIASVVAGIVYIVPFALLAGLATSLVTRSSPILIEAVAGLALVGAFGSALTTALADEEDRLAATLTFLVTASGLTIHGIGAAFWGLCAGLAIHLVMRRPPAP